MKTIECRYLVIGGLLFFAAGLCAWAQTENPQIVKKEVVVATQGNVIKVDVPEGNLPQGATLTWVASEMGFETKLVKGIPFSADSVTEFSQTLSTGQRIYRKTTGAIYRDSEGRTRREQTIEAIGPYATSTPAPQTIFIYDPVAGVSYILDSGNHTATKTAHVSSGLFVVSEDAAGGVRGGVAGGVGGGVTAGVQTGEKNVIHVTTNVPGGTQIVTHRHDSAGNSRTESMGTQVIEGVTAEGKRTVETIPTGAIGNDSPIEIISESWYSPELQVVVKTRHSDPRNGENVYRLTNIRRGEPSPTLFLVPGAFTIKEGPAIERSIVIKKKDGNQ